MANLKLSGAFVGVIEVVLEIWTISMLRSEVSKRLNCEARSINLICGGKLLKDGEEKLWDLGLRNNGKVLVSRLSTDEGESLKKELVADNDWAFSFRRLKDAVCALSKRHLPTEVVTVELTDQAGLKVQLESESDYLGLTQGLMFHSMVKVLIAKKMYKEALDVLAIEEKAFSRCDTEFLSSIDNVPILQIDTVWCYFMLRDMKWLSTAGARLAKARKGLQWSHTEDLARFRALQKDCHPELALYVRLELLEGVVAYHNRRFDKCRKALTSAHSKYLQLQVQYEDLSELMSRGYNEQEARRALRMNNQNVDLAVKFLVRQKEKGEQTLKEDSLRKSKIMVHFKKPLDLEIGYKKNVAVEALQRSEIGPLRDVDVAVEALQRSEIGPLRNVDVAVEALQRSEIGPLRDVGDIEDMEPRDVEMERAIATELVGDSLSDYDFEVTEEGEAITEYLALLDIVR